MSSYYQEVFFYETDCDGDSPYSGVNSQYANMVANISRAHELYFQYRGAHSEYECIACRKTLMGDHAEIMSRGKMCNTYECLALLDSQMWARDRSQRESRWEHEYEYEFGEDSEDSQVEGEWLDTLGTIRVLFE